MMTGQYCTNIFSKQAKDLIAFYKDVLEIPYIKSDVDEYNGVYLGFIENAPTICIWDCNVFDTKATGYQSFVFQTDNLDITIEQLKKKGVVLSNAIKYEWGTYEVRCNDIEGNEIVIVEMIK